MLETLISLINCKKNFRRVKELEAAQRFNMEIMQLQHNDILELRQQIDFMDLAVQYYYGTGVFDVWDKVAEYTEKAKYQSPEVIDLLENCLSKS